MKKIGIVTLTRVFNAGNSLQNYAVQQIYRKMGFDPETLIYIQENYKKRVKRYVKYLVNCKSDAGKEFQRRKRFIEFESQFIKTSPFKNMWSHSENAEKRYDYYSLGSDQVWNPTWYNDKTKHLFMLDFTIPQKKICFSPSIGLDKLPDEWIDFFILGLSSFPHISVRERTAAKLVYELTGKDAEVLIDPTLMLSKSDWIDIENKPDIPIKDNAYVYEYFLGDSPKRIEDDENIIVEKSGIDKIIRYNDIKWKVGPREFIYLIHHASFILTDSFHGSVFSFIFDIPFAVYNRNGSDEMYSRIADFLKLFSIKKHEFSEDQIYRRSKSKLQKSILINEQARVWDFLLNSFSNG